MNGSRYISGLDTLSKSCNQLSPVSMWSDHKRWKLSRTIKTLENCNLGRRKGWLEWPLSPFDIFYLVDWFGKKFTYSYLMCTKLQVYGSLLRCSASCFSCAAWKNKTFWRFMPSNLYLKFSNNPIIIILSWTCSVIFIHLNQYWFWERSMS